MNVPTARVLEVPRLGEGLFEVRIVELLKRPGDRVAEDEPIYVLESDKATLSIESPCAGILSTWRVAAGDVIRIGAPVADLIPRFCEAAAPASSPPPRPAESRQDASETRAKRPEIFVPPRTRAHARRLGLSAEELQAMARPGRHLTPEDVDRHLTARPAPQSSDCPTPEPSEEVGTRRLTERERTLIHRMRRSAEQVIPCTLTSRVRIDGLERVGGDVWVERGMDPASCFVSAFQIVAHAVAQVVREMPRFRSRMLGDEACRECDCLDLGIAVHSADDALVTAVVPGADRMDLVEFLDTFRRSVDEAMAGRDQVGPGTQFVLSNLGASRVTGGTPLLVAPAVAVLAYGELPRSETEDEGRWATLSLTFDHRLIQGVHASRFLEALQGQVEGLRRRGMTGEEGIGRTASGSARNRGVGDASVRQVLAVAAELLGVPEDRLDPVRSLATQGLDSLGAVTLAERLGVLTGIALPATWVWRHPNAAAMAVALEEARPGWNPDPASGARAGRPSRDPISIKRTPTAPSARPSDRDLGDPIAIVGVAFRFPGGIQDLDAFWDLLVRGDSAVGPVPSDRFVGEPDRDWSGGFLDGIDRFDAAFFQISPHEAERMDPQHRLFLETVWHALEDAGEIPSDLAGTRTGVFAAVSNQDYHGLHRDHRVRDAHAAIGVAPSLLSNRVSYLLDLRGPSQTIDTACSGSLVALHAAVCSMRSGDCDQAVVGGANLFATLDLFRSFADAGMLAPDGRNRTFDAGATGYVRGEGVAAVLLKPLSAALRDGNPVHAVIRGSAVNHGGRSASLTAPNPGAQSDLLQAAWRSAGIVASDLGYIEAHGTGTPLGDPIEVEALTAAYGSGRGTGLGVFAPSCVLGSVKPNLGHLEAVAGLAGVIKMIACFRASMLPPSAELETINPHLPLADGPFSLLREPRGWQTRAGADGRILRRRAGISSFGFGGANAHVVLEEPPARDGGPVPTPGCILLSARDPEALHRAVERLVGHLRRHPEIPLDSVIETLRNGRTVWRFRLACMGASVPEVVERLASHLRGGEVPGVFVGNASATPSGPVPSGNEEADLEARARAWVLGGAHMGQGMRGTARPVRIPLPGYPFAGERHWIGAAIPAAARQPLASPPPAPGRLLAFVPEWQRVEISPSAVPRTRGGRWLMVGGELADLEAVRVVHPDVSWMPDAGTLSPEGLDVDAVLCLPPGGVGSRLGGAVWSAFQTVRVLLQSGHGSRVVRWISVTRGAEPWHWGDAVRVEDAGVHGLAGTLAREYPDWDVTTLDLAPGDPVPMTALAALPRDPAGHPWLFRRGAWHRRHLVRIEPGPRAASIRAFQVNGVHVVIGGAGGLGRLWTRHLIQTSRARVVWIGRRPVDDEGVRAALEGVSIPGCRPEYWQADVTDEMSLRRVFRSIRERMGRMDSVVHAAVAGMDQSLERMEDEAFQASFRAKATGSRVLAEVVQEEPPGVLIFFSSMAAVTTDHGKAAYAAATGLQDALAADLAGRVGCPVRVVDWGYWGEVGIGRAIPQSVKNRLHQAGFLPIPEDEAWMAVERMVLDGPPRQVVVGAVPDIDLQETLLDGVSWRPIGSRTELRADPAVVPLPPGPDLESHRELVDCLESHLLGLLGMQLERSGIVGAEWVTTAELGRRVLGPVHLRRWLEKALLELGAHGHLETDRDRIRLRKGMDGVGVESWSARRARLLADPRTAGWMRLSEMALGGLPEILTGRTAATEVLFAGAATGAVEGVYGGNPVADHFNEVLAGWIVSRVSAVAGRDPAARFRILEIGAGTGATSRVLLQRLQPWSDQIAEYAFTDVSRAFLNLAEQRGSGIGTALRFEVLDITRDPRQQGFPEGGYDVVVASNVLHATPDIRSTLRHAKVLLRKGGMLAINEISSGSVAALMTFGLLEGWWLTRDPEIRIPGCPGLLPGAWQRMFVSEGFSPVVFPDPGSHGLGQQVVIGVSDGWVRHQRSGGVTTGVPAAIPPAQQPKPSSIPPVRGDAEALRAGATLFLRNLLGETLKIPPVRIDPEEPLETYGIDSILVMQLTNRLRRDFPDVKSSLFFEVRNLRGLADHFVAQAPDRLGRLVGLADRPSPPREPLVSPAVMTTSTGALARVSSVDPAPRVPVPVSEAGRPGPELIAIIGMSGAFPMASDLDAYWENLVSGRDCVGEVPRDRWRIDGFHEPDRARAVREGRSYTKAGAFIDGFADFDPLFFGIPPVEALAMDPQERLFLEHSWRAMEDAGITREILAVRHGGRVGVFAGITSQGFAHHAPTYWSLDEPIHPVSPISSAANRVSYFLNLHGPSLPVDTMCSSSLTAVHLACDHLRRGEVDLAFAGGVHLNLHPSGHVALCAKGMLSPTGRCRSFGKGADGFVPGEGVGVVLLKPLSRALADGDSIHAVIRGSHVNHGGRTQGYTVPNPHAQSELVSETLRRAGVEASSIGCVEAHGTGTELGDPIEAAALAKAFGPTTPGARCALGSVKSNIGHLEAAAGIAGLLKVVLQLRHRTLVPTLHAEEVNPEIPFEGTPFFIPRETIPWAPADVGIPRRAGISSFGAGGANAHVILEEAPEVPFSPVVDEPCLILLSARTPKALREVVGRLLAIARHSGGGGGLLLRDVAHTLQVGREAMEERFGAVVASWAELSDRLGGFMDGASEGTGTVRPDRGPEGEALRLLEEDEDLRVGVEALLQKGRLHRLLTLWLRGVRIDWTLLPVGACGTPRRVSLPTYPFQRQRLWITGDPVTPDAPDASGNGDLNRGDEPPVDLAFMARWQEMEERANPTPLHVDGVAWCVDLGTGLPHPDTLVDALRHAGADSVSRVDWTASWGEEDLDPVLPDPGSVRCVVIRVSQVDPGGVWTGDCCVLAFFRLVRWLRSRIGMAQRVDLFVVGTDAQPRFETGSSRAEGAAVLGLAGSLAQSDRGFRVRLVDASAPDLRGEETPFWKRVLGLPPSDRGEVVRWESGSFHRRVFLPMRPLPSPQPVPGAIRDGGVYVIVGGAGSVGRAITRHLIRRHDARVVWIGRRAATSEPVLRALGSVAGEGQPPLYISADVRDPEAMRSAVDAIRARLGPIQGAVFSAVVSEGSAALGETTEEQFRAVLETKTAGSRVFQETLGVACSDFVCHFSSIQAFSFTSSRDSAAYAAGIAYADAVARHAASSSRPAIGCIHWGYWRTFAEGTGLAARVRGRFGLIEDAEGAAFFEWFVGQLRAGTVTNVLAVRASEPVRQSMAGSVSGDAVALCDRGRSSFIEAAVDPGMDASWMELDAMQGTVDAFESVLFRWMAASIRRIPGFDPRHPERLPAAVLPRYRRWWSECLAGLGRSVLDAGSGDEGWGGQRDRFVSDPTLRARVPLVEECLAALADILTGRTAPTDLLFPGGSLARVRGVYRDNPIADHFNEQVAESVRRLVDGWFAEGRGQMVRLLEIGGGTGGTTASILRRVQADGERLEYRFTDLSKAFLLEVQDRHGPKHPGLSAGILDVSLPPERQGLELGSFDIVVATNVLHATPDIRSTVRHVRSLLCRNGVLLLNEVTRKTWFQFLTFGLLDGWWLFRDPDLRVPGSPVLETSSWLRVLREEGLRAIGDVPRGDDRLGQHVFVAESDGWVVRTGPSELAPASSRPSPVVSTASESRVAGASSTSDPDPIRRVEEVLTHVLCQTIRISETEVRRDMAFADYGIDSILTGNLVDRLAVALGVSIGSTILFEHGTIARLAKHLVGVHGPGLGCGIRGKNGNPAIPPPDDGKVPGMASVEPSPGDTQQRPMAGVGGVRSLDIAVIGFSGQFPGASDPECFWRNLSEGVESITQLPPNYLPPELHSAGEKVRGCAYSNRGGVLDERDCFDPLFFRISPREAESMNPHQRLVLEEGWKALEDAAVDPRGLSGRPVGLFVGAEPSGYWHETLSGYSDAIVASRLSYHLNLKGPAFTVNTGCSSSAVALHLACRSLRDRETDLALAGGVFAAMDSRLLVSMSQIEMLSRSGSCRTFDASADGTVLSEGVGMLVLKRLEDAVADGDPIHGVIVGTGINQDGASNGITAPNGSAQEDLIVGVYERHGIDPADISYVEAHGTATPLGDPVEANALVRAFRRLGRGDEGGGICRVGSVKANIGHTAAGAAAIGLIKLLLSLRHRRLPGLPNFRGLNPRIEFAGSPFAVCDRSTSWDPGRSGFRMASLNAFGHSGTNAHIVVREHHVDPAPGLRPVDWNGRPVGPANPMVIPLSARTPEALASSARRLAAFIRLPSHGESGQPLRIEEIAWTWQGGREAMECRAGCVAGDLETLCIQLDRIAQGVDPIPVDTFVPSAMRGLLERWIARAPVDWLPMYGARLPGRIHLPTYRFARDRYWMPASPPVPPLPHSVPGNRVVRVAWSAEDPLIADHVVGGRIIIPAAFLLEQVRAAVAAHPVLTGGGHPGLVMEDVAWLRPIEAPMLGGSVSIELESGPQKIVFRVVSTGGNPGDGGRRLHCTGSVSRTGNGEVGTLPAASGPVMATWTGMECLRRFSEAGLDYGPAFQRVDRIDLRGDVAEVFFTPSTSPSQDSTVLDPALVDAGWQGVLVLVGDEASGGLPFAVDRVGILSPMHGVRSATLRRLAGTGPGVFRFDVDWRDADGRVVVWMHGYTVRVPSQSRDPGLLALVPRWERVEEPGAGTGVMPVGKVLVIGLPDAWFGELAKGLSGIDCERLDVAEPLMPEGASHVVQRLIARLRDHWRSLSESNRAVVVVIPGTGEADVLSGLQGLLRSVELEDPRFRCHLVEWDPSVPAPSAVRLLSKGLGPMDGAGWWRVTPEALWRRSWDEMELPSGRDGWMPRDGGVYLITGGRGGVGRLWTRYLSRLGRRLTLVLAGRSPVGPDDLESIPEGTVRILHRQADVSDRGETERLVAGILATEGRLDGVFHAAGVVRDAYLIRKEPGSVREVLGGKWQGAVHLDVFTAGLDLDVFVLFSSMAAIVGNAGQSDYAAANGLLNGFARWRQERVDRGERRGRTLSVDWPLWREGGMRVSEDIVARLEERAGLRPLGTSEGIRCLTALLCTSHPQVWVLAGDVARLRAAGVGRGRLIMETRTSRLDPPSTAVGPAEVASVPPEVVSDLLRRRLAPVLRVPPPRLGLEETWDAFGIDSILAMDLTTALEEVFGPLPRTLFFEYQTLQALAGYFIRSHGSRLAEVYAGSYTTESGSASIPALELKGASPSAPTGSAPVSPLVEAPPSPPSTSGSMDIAIIGIAGRYPKARDLEAFWRNLRDGVDCITEIPADRWDHRLFYDEDRNVPGKTYSKWGGFIDGIAEFDPLYFNISPREAAILDPQERLFLQCAQEVAEDAGYTRAGFGLESGGGPGREVGVFVGVMYEEYPLHGAQETLRGRPMALTGSPASIANRVSHFLDLRGPSFAVDTMCSSSLTAIHLACQSLLRGECRMAFAGGVNLSLHPNKYLMLGQGRFVSAKGRCESFGEGAEGYVPAEGVGAVLLKPVARALADGDRIHAVIRGTAINHGGRTHGYTVPNPNGQAQVIGRALDAAGVEARTISYLEAHGTGTVLGDPIEIAGLARAFSERTSEVGFCALGSVKSNIGHAESAAGIAALTKVVLQMRHRQLVPSLHSRTLNPAIDFASTPFVVQQSLSEWMVSPGNRRRAGISSFGAGGGNAHVVVEEPPHAVQPERRGIAAFVVSARTPGQLRDLAGRLSLRLEDPAVDLLDVAWTLQVGREAFDERLAFVAASREEACAILSRFASGTGEIEGLFRGNARRQRDSVAFLSGDEDMEHTLSAWVGKGRIDRILELWTRGLPVDWRRLSAIRGARRVGLPHYPFAAERCWFSDSLPVAIPETAPVPQVDAAAGWLALERRWNPVQSMPAASTLSFTGRVLLLTMPGDVALVELLRRRLPNARVLQVETLPDGTRPDPAWTAGWEACVDLSGLSAGGMPPRGWILGSQALAESAARQGIRWIGVTRGLHPSGSPPASPDGSMQAAWFRLISFEHPAIRSAHLDLDPGSGIDAAVGAILNLLTDEDAGTSYQLRQGGLHRAEFHAVPLGRLMGDPSPVLASGEVLWVTGGTRGLGALCARHFVTRHGVRSVVLTGRDPLPDRSDWVRLRDGTGAVAERIRLVESLESEGARVRVLALPLDDREAVMEARRQVELDWGRIGGVLHAAGSADARHPAWIRKPLASIAAVWSPKTAGLDVLLEVFRAQPPRFVVLFSSVSGAVPALGAGLADYAMANAYQDAVAQAWQGQPRVLSIQWPLWGESGSAAGAPVPRAYIDAGFRTHSDREGLDLLDRLLREGRRGVVLPAQVDLSRWNPETLLRSRFQPSAGSAGSIRGRGVRKIPGGTPDPEIPERMTTARDWLRGVLSTELKLEGSRIEEDVPFADYGADSVLLAQVLRRIRDRLGSDVDPSLLLERPTLGAVARWLAEHPAWDGTEDPGGEPHRRIGRTSAKEISGSLESRSPAPQPRPGERRDIAVVGMSCRMPGAPDLGSFWDLVRTGRRAIGRAPEGRWASGSDWLGGWMDEVGWFDPGAFLIREEDVRVMDPQALLLLEEAVRTLCDAGYRIDELRRRPIGVYVGGRSRHVPDEALLARSRNPIRAAGPNYLAANVSQFLDWQGPSLVVDTACSSALVALQMAVQALHSGEIEAAWVAGVSVMDSDSAHRLFASRGILARSGEFHVFDARAAGVVPAEGAGGILLKTVGRAHADGDRVHAVIRGIAVNNDGRTAGPATPNPEAQREVMRKALERSGIAPEEVCHIEVNGSGSEVTDLLELKAIQSVYRPDGGTPCWLGSVKPNLGHPLAAEGIAALIKVILMVREGRIAPFLSGQQPPRHFDLAETPFLLPRGETRWSDPVRRAALNCFADGGTNVHVLVESAVLADSQAQLRQVLQVPSWHRRPWSTPGPAGSTVSLAAPGETSNDSEPKPATASTDLPPARPWRFERTQAGPPRMNRWRRAR